MPTFGEAARQMKIDDATMVRHIDALLRDFVADNRTLLEGDLPTESALSEAGWRLFREGRLRLRCDELLPRIEPVSDPDNGKAVRRQNLKWWRVVEALQTAGEADPFFSMVD
jgi:hypothetical protein